MKNTKLIAKKPVKERNIQNIDTEDNIIKIVNSTKKILQKNKATKIFQALRMFVNNEISELISGYQNLVT